MPDNDRGGSGSASLTVDDDLGEMDEGYSTSIGSSYLTTLASNVRKGVVENGRVYPDYGRNQYGLPMDEAELDRNDLQHAKFTMLLEGLHLAPITPYPQEILDLGTGTGIWAIGKSVIFLLLVACRNFFEDILMSATIIIHEIHQT